MINKLQIACYASVMLDWQGRLTAQQTVAAVGMGSWRLKGVRPFFASSVAVYLSCACSSTYTRYTKRVRRSVCVPHDDPDRNRGICCRSDEPSFREAGVACGGHVA